AWLQQPGKKVVLSDAVCTQAFPSHGTGLWLLGEERLAREKAAMEQLMLSAEQFESEFQQQPLFLSCFPL
ncbi:MAG: hypothetical protein PT958_05990, partial [Firmicutes bacterium]|nr:hypothetical protein [Bacillota bacterium]MDY2720787.1 hypothetical protein [Candidatus Faecousia sp.]